MQPGDVIEFNRRKQFKYVRPLGNGGTGDTHLFLDDTTNMHFAIKKYSPKQEEYRDEFYERFVDEIKILFNLSHPNIVRVYNYYLYPEAKLGYLQMEYIKGMTINEYTPVIWGKEWEAIFTEIILAFKYLEENHVLHRDIRPANIMIDDYGNVKIIDFGFGKMLKSADECGQSVFLNWPVTERPEEVILNGTYTHQSEIYFVGKLFQHLLREYGASFRYSHILDKMVKASPEERHTSFEEIEKEISLGVLGELDFSEAQKGVYQSFANSLCQHITNYVDKYEPVNELQQILVSLSTVIRKSALETFIQDNSLLIRAFIKGRCRYIPIKDIRASCVTAFYKLINQLDAHAQKIVIDNIYLRLSNIDVVIEPDDDLPF